MAIARLRSETICFPSKDVAIADGRYEIIGGAGGDSRMWSTFVMTREDDDLAHRRHPQHAAGTSGPVIAAVTLPSALVLCLLGLTRMAAAQDWPEFRGPGGQGHSSERGLPLEWSEARNIVWKSAVPGRGGHLR